MVIDTSVFKSQNMALYDGKTLTRLCILKELNKPVIMPDILEKEIKKHFFDHISEETNKIKNSVESIKKCLLKDYEVYKTLETVNNYISCEVIFKNYLGELGYVPIDCKDYINIDDLFNCYFDNKPPFEKEGKKKCEFPDAAILLTIEKYAKDNLYKVLAVSNDNDWGNFAKNSENILI